MEDLDDQINDRAEDMKNIADQKYYSMIEDNTP